MKNKLSMILIIALFISGIGLLSYPAVSDYLVRRSQGEIISDYENTLDQLSAEQREEVKARTQEYNVSLIGNAILTDPFEMEGLEEQDEEYEELLNINGDGMIGYIEIPQIDVNIPVYHGVSAEILQKGAGHLKDTSLPIGGKGTHSVLSAHSGHPTAEFFTDLNKLEKKDVFYLKVLNETLAYEINQIKVVEPEDTSDLFIDINEDYVTLVTCTPYGINSHRLLVRGRRIPYNEAEKEAAEGTRESWHLADAYLIVIPIAIILLLLIYRRYKRKNEK